MLFVIGSSAAVAEPPGDLHNPILIDDSNRQPSNVHSPAPASSMASSRVRDALTAKRPAYTPVPHTDHDDPSSDATKLPPVLVRAPSLKLPQDVQILTSKEFARQLRKAYPGASVPGQDPLRVEHGPPNYARLQYENDRRIQRESEISDVAVLAGRTGDRDVAERLKKELQRTRGSTYKDPLLDAMDKSANGGRR